MKPKLGTGARFSGLVKKLESQGKSAESAKKISAWAGMKKFGKEKMSEMAHNPNQRKGGKGSY